MLSHGVVNDSLKNLYRHGSKYFNRTGLLDVKIDKSPINICRCKIGVKDQYSRHGR